MTNLKKIVILLMACLCGCAHTKINSEPLLPGYLSSIKAKPLTSQGINADPHFSPDSMKVIYSSRERSSHKGSQIYEFDLTTAKERRITYSDGDAFDPTYISDDEILYSSTTDEIKENPFINKNYNRDTSPSEIYMSDLYGSEILRLTNQPGRDAGALFVNHTTKPYILFTSLRNGAAGIFQLTLDGLATHPLAVDAKVGRKFLALSPDKKQIAYVEKNFETQEQSLVLQNLKTKKKEILKFGEGAYQDLVFAPRSPTRLFYSLLRKGDTSYRIEVYGLDERCTRVLIQAEDNLTQPSISGDSLEKIAFVRSYKETQQIYIAPLPDGSPCLENTLGKPSTIDSPLAQ